MSSSKGKELRRTMRCGIEEATCGSSFLPKMQFSKLEKATHTNLTKGQSGPLVTEQNAKKIRSSKVSRSKGRDLIAKVKIKT
jgi:hypothetical protein